MVGAHLEGARLLLLVARARWGAVEVEDAVLGLHVLPHVPLCGHCPILLAWDAPPGALDRCTVHPILVRLPQEATPDVTLMCRGYYLSKVVC